MSAAAQERGSSWRRLAVGAAAGTAVVLVVAAFVSQTYLLLIPPVLLLAGAWLTAGRTGRAGPIVLLVVALLFLLTNFPFLIPYFKAPSSALNFILTTTSVIGCLLTAGAAVGALRSRRSSRAPAVLALGALALVALSVVTGVVAAIAYNPPRARPGDLRLSASGIKFSRGSLEAQGSSISVFVTNHDTVLHTFTIDRLHVNLNIPASSTGRVTFQAEAGTYRYYCAVHTNMQGTLTIR